MAHEQKGHPEPAPPQTAEERARDLEYAIQRAREALGTDLPVTDDPRVLRQTDNGGGNPTPLQRPPSRLYEVRTVHGEAYAALADQVGQDVAWLTLWNEGVIALRLPSPDVRALRAVDPDEMESAAEDDLAEARMWARHGYEIGQRHCGWTDHGTAPAWLTEGWPRSFDSCEHLRQASEYDTALTRVRGLPDQPEVMDPSRPYSDDYLLGYRMAIGTAKRLASNEPTNKEKEQA